MDRPPATYPLRHTQIIGAGSISPACPANLCRRPANPLRWKRQTACPSCSKPPIEPFSPMPRQRAPPSPRLGSRWKPRHDSTKPLLLARTHRPALHHRQALTPLIHPSHSPLSALLVDLRDSSSRPLSTGYTPAICPTFSLGRASRAGTA